MREEAGLHQQRYERVHRFIPLRIVRAIDQKCGMTLRPANKAMALLESRLDELDGRQWQ
jgi:hypothetical protein